MVTFHRDRLDALFAVLRDRGYRLIGPTVRDHAIVYDTIRSADDLPAGRTDEQQPASYRLRDRDDAAVFAHAVGPRSWKHFLFPPRQLLFRSSRTAPKGAGRSSSMTVEPPSQADLSSPTAFIGVRPCDLAAIRTLDRVFLEGPYRDPGYAARRASTFLVVVNCSQPSATCFCASMGTGPGASSGGDLILTEVIEGGSHFFTALATSERGSEVLAGVSTTASTDDETRAAADIVTRSASAQRRALPANGVRESVLSDPEHPRWHTVATRCLSCGNCTMACPTCFCTTVEDVADLTNANAERWRRWDSCFALEHSYIHGGSVRPSVMARYRQWLTHKLGTWHEQYGTSGCVGCGRCITWCPAAIDITEEVAALSVPAHAAHVRHREHGDAKPQVHPS